jgi:1-aminocyclopropane-1-carboxylate deaminase
MFYGIFDLINKDFFKEGMKILAVHTGGLQYLG